MSNNGTRWVGVDVHRRRSQIAIIDEHRERTVSRRIANDRESFLELRADPDATIVALEATCGWEWLAELLQEAGHDVHLAHPLRTRITPSSPPTDGRSMAFSLSTSSGAPSRFGTIAFIALGSLPYEAPGEDSCIPGP